MEIIIALVQALLLVLLAPLVSGSARWLRAKMHTRKGPSILQDYYDIAKLFRRQDVHPKDSSFVHKLMPPLFMGVLLVLAMGIPMITMASPIAWLGDIILVLYLLALPRFFFSLSAIDSSDAYAGIGDHLTADEKTLQERANGLEHRLENKRQTISLMEEELHNLRHSVKLYRWILFGLSMLIVVLIVWCIWVDLHCADYGLWRW